MYASLGSNLSGHAMLPFLTLDVLSWAVLLRADSYIRDSRGDYFGRFISCFAASIGERRSSGSAFKD